MSVLGLDVGGANIKVSDGESRSVSRPFPLWQRPSLLESELSGLLKTFGPIARVAVTMTGELADCFPSKAAGVDHILGSIEAATSARVIVWQTGGEFVTPEEARSLTRLVAAANWHALATWTGRMVPKSTGLLMDMGSTTTDLIPLQEGAPVPEGATDVQRLLSGELLYTGVRRTPICAVLPSVPLRGGHCPLAAELFATMDDVYLVLGDVDVEETNTATADGRPRTQPAALDRLARMICCDATEVTEDELVTIAAALARAQTHSIGLSLSRVLDRLPQPPRQILLAGEGEFVIRRALSDHDELAPAELVSLQQTLGPLHSQAACAFALARLASERPF